MGTGITAKNTNAIDAGERKISMPVVRGLEAIHFLSGSIGRAVRNYAIGKPDASPVGAPVESANYMTFKGLTNFIQTKDADFASQTIFRVMRTLDTMVDVDHSPVFDGTYSSGSNIGTMLYGNIGGNVNQTAARFIDATQTQLTTGAATMVAGTDIVTATFSLIVTTVGADRTTVRNETLGTSKQGPVNTFGRRPSTLPFRIGSAYEEGNTKYRGTCDMAFWQHHSVELTASEREATVQKIRSLMFNLHGITV